MALANQKGGTYQGFGQVGSVQGFGAVRNEISWLFGLAPGTGPVSTVDQWAPAVDILEDEKAITVKVELPEVDKKDVDVQIRDDCAHNPRGAQAGT